MKELSGKAAVITGLVTGSALDGTSPKIIIALALVTIILAAIAIGGKER